MSPEALEKLITNTTSVKRQSPETQKSQPTVTMFVKQWDIYISIVKWEATTNSFEVHLGLFSYYVGHFHTYTNI